MSRPDSGRLRLALIGIGVGLAALVAVANAHLVHVALASDPGCVPHRATPGEGGTLRAAKPGC